MTARVTKTKVTFNNVMNESLGEEIREAAEQAESTIETLDCGTKLVVMGNLDKFIEIYNNLIA